MTNKAQRQQTYFHVHKNSRLNNPTYISHFVQDSLTLYSPQKQDKVQNIKSVTEYTSHFEPLADKVNIFNPPSSFHYGKYSQQAFQKNKSFLSQYGSSIMSPTSYEKRN